MLRKRSRTDAKSFSTWSSSTPGCAPCGWIDNAPDRSDLASAMREHGCLAGVNGSLLFSGPDTARAGDQRREGASSTPSRRGCSAACSRSDGSGVSLLRTREFKPSANVTQALQAGPFLVDGGRVVPGAERENKGTRETVSSGNGKGRCALLVSDPVTLAELAQISRETRHPSPS